LNGIGLSINWQKNLNFRNLPFLPGTEKIRFPRYRRLKKYARHLALTDRNCHFGIFAVLGQNSVFAPNYDFLQPEQLIQSQLTTDPITIFRQRRLGEV